MAKTKSVGSPLSLPTKCSKSFVAVTLILYCFFVAPKHVGGSYTPPENLTIAQIFSTQCPPCTVGVDGFVHRSVGRMIIEKINNDPNILPNTTLIMKHYDTYGDSGAASIAMAAAATSNIEAVVGGFHSACSKPMATIAEYYRLPQISGGSTNDQLSDTTTYPYFMRSVSGDGTIAPIISEVIKNVGWKNVATLCTEDDFASSAISEFERVATSEGLNIATSISFAFPGTYEAAKEAMIQIRDSGIRIVVAFLISQDFDFVVQAAYDLGMVGDKAIQWVLSTAELRFRNEDDQDDVFNAVTKGLIGVQPYLGGGDVYDHWNTIWKSLPACEVDGCDSPFLPSPDLSRYTWSNHNLTQIPYGAYYSDALLTIIYSFQDLVSREIEMCHGLRDNPCTIETGSLLDIEWDTACLESTPCTSALMNRLRSVNEINKVGLTGPLQWQSDSNDRLLQYEVRNWRAGSEAVFVASYDQTSKAFTPNLREFATSGGIEFNGGMYGIPSDTFSKDEGDDEVVLHFVIIPLGGVVAVILAIVALSRHAATLEVLVKMTKRTVVLILSLTFELTDIVSDILVLVVLISSNDEEVRSLLVWYALFVACGTCLFLFHVLVNGMYLYRLFTHATNENFKSLQKQVLKREKKMRYLRGTKRRAKGGGMATVVPANEKELTAGNSVLGSPKDKQRRRDSRDTFESKLKFVECAHECSIVESQIHRIVALFGLFLLEDLPMGLLNIILMSREGCNDDGGVRPVVLFSLIVGTLMVAFKLSQLSNLPGLQSSIKLLHANCMKILAQIG